MGKDEEKEEPPVKRQKVSEDDNDEADEPKVIGPDVWYMPSRPEDGGDVSEKLIAQSYKAFTMPSEEEGFKEVEFTWRPKAEAEDHLQKYILKMKASLVIDDLRPSEWFKDKLKAWKTVQSEMRKKGRQEHPKKE